MSLTNTSDDVYIKPGRHIAARMMADEMVVMSMKDSRVFILNSTAARIWKVADGKTRLCEIVTRELISEFEVEAETAYSDAIELVEKLAEQGILLVSTQPI